MLLHCPVYSCCTDSFSTSLCIAAVLICPTSLCIAAVPFLYWPVHCGRSVFVLPCFGLLYCVCVGRCTDAVLLVRAGLCGTRGASEDGGAHDGGGGGGGLLVPVLSFRIGLCTAAVM